MRIGYCEGVEERSAVAIARLSGSKNLVDNFFVEFFFARRPAMLGLMGFSGSLPLYVIH